jgi:hypothetical protein
LAILSRNFKNEKFSIYINSPFVDLDLEGVNVLLIPTLNALNAVFKLKYPQKEDTTAKTDNKPKENVRSLFNIGSSSITLVELKRYCIYIFSSLLCLPNHFNSLLINDTVASGLSFFSLRSKILEIFLAAMTNEQDTTNLQMLFGCGRLIVGEWSLDELQKTPDLANFDKKEKASYCYNQIVSLICAPLKINHATLQNHSFALSIFDSLASIAAGDILNQDESVCKIAISWIWHYVKMQIKRRSKEHTKEMHSVIVAAYNCLIMLLITKPNLLRDKNCLQTVANCIEIGISGSSSYPEQKLREDAKEASSQTLMKAEKELRPASLRVKEAAECVLCFLMEHSSSSTGIFDNNDTTRSPLDERSINELTNKTAPAKYKYFAVDGSLILGVLEKPLLKSPISNICPNITILIRGPFGRQAWSLHLRNSPFSDLNPLREIKLNVNSEPSGLKYYPNRATLKYEADSSGNKLDESNDSSRAVPKCELSVPTLNDVAAKCVKNLSKFQRLKEEQIEFESLATDRVANENLSRKPNPNEISLNMKIYKEFQSARMFLSHLGYCSTDSIKMKEDGAEMLSLESNDAAFVDQLSVLDHLPTRTFSTCHVFYVKKSQADCKSILANVSKPDSIQDEGFYAFIQSLGVIIDVSNQSGENSTGSQSEAGLIKKLNKINGVDNVLYWSDISSEVTFVIPSSSGDHAQTGHVDEAFKVKNQNVPNDIRVMIVWLEQIQDADSVPIGELFNIEFKV